MLSPLFLSHGEIMAWKHECGQSLKALFLFVFIGRLQIPCSVGVWGNGLEGWCQ